MNASSLRWILALLPLLVASCSTAGFERQWKTTVAAQKKHPSPDITGAWTGTWRSDANGHHGVLRCLVTREAEKSDNYRFYYHATYGSVLTAAYTVTEQVHRNRAGAYDISGEHNLGYFAGGLYHYQGASTVQNMKSTYRSSADRGVFELARP